jgi:hypothetical protein
MMWGYFSHLLFFIAGMLAGLILSHRVFKRALKQATAMFQAQHNSAVASADRRLADLEALASELQSRVQK